MFSDPKKVKFLFKCQGCQMILSVDLETEEDLKQVRDGEMILECACKSLLTVLRD
jgi:hypothetical protein